MSAPSWQLAEAYCAMASVWMCLSLRYWRELFHIQPKPRRYSSPRGGACILDACCQGTALPQSSSWALWGTGRVSRLFLWSLEAKVEAFLQWRFFMDWNESGLRGRPTISNCKLQSSQHKFCFIPGFGLWQVLIRSSHLGHSCEAPSLDPGGVAAQPA